MQILWQDPNSPSMEHQLAYIKQGERDWWWVAIMIMLKVKDYLLTFVALRVEVYTDVEIALSEKKHSIISLNVESKKQNI